MCERLFGGGLVDLDQLFPQSSSTDDKSNGQIFNLDPLSAEDQKQFQELLSGEPSEFCPKRWAREE